MRKRRGATLRLLHTTTSFPPAHGFVCFSFAQTGEVPEGFLVVAGSMPAALNSNLNEAQADWVRNHGNTL